MPAKKKIDNILDIVNGENVSLRLFFITRQLKDGFKTSTKAVDKFNFSACQVDISNEIAEFFKNNVKNQLSKLLKIEPFEQEDYSVICDDLGDKLLTYAYNEQLSFSGVMNNIHAEKASSLNSLKDIKSEIWAYCLRLEDINNGTVFLLKKTSSGKVATDEPQSKLEKLSAWFDSSESELKTVKHETITFDDKFDCINFNKEFLVLRKHGFEQLVGLEEEFIKAANDVVSVIEQTNLVHGIEHIKCNIKKSRAMLKTLANIGKKGAHSSFNAKEIESMKKALKKFEDKELEVNTDGKIVLNDLVDVGYFIKLLNDYYKIGAVSGKYYGTNSGHLIKKK